MDDDCGKDILGQDLCCQDATLTSDCKGACKLRIAGNRYRGNPASNEGVMLSILHLIARRTSRCARILDERYFAGARRRLLVLDEHIHSFSVVGNSLLLQTLHCTASDVHYG